MMDITWPLYLGTFLWVVAISLLSTLLGRLGGSAFGKAYWIIVAPGVAFHEFSHFLACKLTFTRVTNVKLFGREGGFVEHEKRNFLISAIIGSAPIVVSVATMMLLGLFMLKTLGAVSVSGSSPLPVAWNVAVSLVKMIAQGGYSDWRIYAFLFVAFQLASTMSPSSQDLKNSWVGLLLIGVLGAIPLIVFHFWNWGGNILLDGLSVIIEGLLLAVGWGLFVCLLAIILILPVWIVRKIVG